MKWPKTPMMTPERMLATKGAAPASAMPLSTAPPIATMAART
jgi:hypothetical protein